MAEHLALRSVVLSKLSRWGSLTLGDLMDMLPLPYRQVFDPSLLDQLEREGLVRTATAGDERVISLSDKGKRALETGGSGQSA